MARRKEDNLEASFWKRWFIIAVVLLVIVAGIFFLTYQRGSQTQQTQTNSNTFYLEWNETSIAGQFSEMLTYGNSTYYSALTNSDFYSTNFIHKDTTFGMDCYFRGEATLGLCLLTINYTTYKIIGNWTTWF